MITSRPDRKCMQPGCPNIGNWKDSAYCPDHSKDYPRQKAHGLRDKWWLKFIALHTQLNPICQRVGPCPGEPRHGHLCGKPVYYRHHLIEVEHRPDLRLDQRNVVGVCSSCHVRPGDRDQGRYIPTRWRTPMSDEPIPDLMLPGEVVPKGVVLWTVSERLAALGEDLTGYPVKIYF